MPATSRSSLWNSIRKGKMRLLVFTLTHEPQAADWLSSAKHRPVLPYQVPSAPEGWRRADPLHLLLLHFRLQASSGFHWPG